MAKKNSMPTKVPLEEMLYVQKCVSGCRFLVDIPNLRIDIPIGMELNDCMFAMELRSKFKFQGQYVFEDAKLNENKFDPKMNTNGLIKGDKKSKRSKPAAPPAPTSDFRVGDSFITRMNEHIQVFASKKKSKSNTILTMLHVGTMTPNFDINLLTAQINVGRGVWKIKQSK